VTVFRMKTDAILLRCIHKPRIWRRAPKTEQTARDGGRRSRRQRRDACTLPGEPPPAPEKARGLACPALRQGECGSWRVETSP
jgi:hypothetical protein